MEEKRQAFLDALEADEDDNVTRLVYSDWLDEMDECEEADRMRKWADAKAWLVALCANHTETELSWITQVTYHELLYQMNAAVLQQERRQGLAIWCGNNEDIAAAINDEAAQVWSCWSIITGNPIPEGIEEFVVEAEAYEPCGC